MDRDEEALLRINHRGLATKQMIYNIIEVYFHETSLTQEIC